jgi:hypothetical protein
MNAARDRCDVVSGLVASWQAGTMRDVDRNAYEQHLLYCPPCLIQNDKARLALTALRSAPVTPPSDDLVARLTERITTWAGGG